MTFTDDMLGEMEEGIRNKEAKSDEEVEHLVDEIQGALGLGESPDLKAYHNARMSHRREETEQGMSELERLVSRVASFLGFTPERRYARGVAKTEKLYAYMNQAYHEHLKKHDSMRKLVTTRGREVMLSQGLLELCMHRYEKKQAEADRLEVEVESMAKACMEGNGLALYEKREQLNNVRQHLIGLVADGDAASRELEMKSDDYQELQGVLKNYEEPLMRFGRQKNALQVKIAKAKQKQSLFMGNGRPSLQELYEEAGLAAEWLDKLSAHEHTQVEGGFDSMYSIAPKNRAQNKLVGRWYEMRKSSSQD